MSQGSPALSRLADLFRDFYTVRDAAGAPIEWSLARHQNSFRYLEGRDGNWYCWTPHRDTKGRFWSWVYTKRQSGMFKVLKIQEHKMRLGAINRAGALHKLANQDFDKAESAKAAAAAKRAARRKP